MDDEKLLQEKLRESACNGDLEELRKLIREQGVDVNSQNSVNGWTALHWAAKRNHESVVKYLLSEGADPNLTNNTGQKPAQISTEKNIQLLLGGDENLEVHESNLPITPNYLANPPFPYIKNGGAPLRSMEPVHPQQHPALHSHSTQELVLKARLANSDERDFIEVELQRDKCTFEAFLNLLCSELGVDRKLVYKIRKLPDTIVRKDKDVQRLVDFQEVEVVLSNKATSASSRNYGIVGGSVPRQEQILY